MHEKSPTFLESFDTVNFAGVRAKLIATVPENSPKWRELPEDNSPSRQVIVMFLKQSRQTTTPVSLTNVAAQPVRPGSITDQA